MNFVKIVYMTNAGAADQGGPGGPGPPLKLEIYLVKFLEKDRISFFFLLGPPLEKNCSSAPVCNHLLVAVKTVKTTTRVSFVPKRLEIKRVSPPKCFSK